MTSIATTITAADGTQYRSEAATIAHTRLGVDPEVGIFTLDLRVEFGDGSSVTAGGWTLDAHPTTSGGSREPAPGAGKRIAEVLAAAGVDFWENLIGAKVFVLWDNGFYGGGVNPRACGIASLDGSRVVL